MVDTHTYIKKEQARRSVVLTLTDGTVLEGQIVMPSARPIGEFLNSGHTFFEFEYGKGDKCFLAKPSIQTVHVSDVPKLEQRIRKSAENAKFVPV